MARRRMAAGTAVIDTSCLLSLLSLNLLAKAVLRYGVIYVPQHVLAEVNARWHDPDGLRRLLKHHTFLRKCSIGDENRVKLLYDRRMNPRAPIHRGEAEAIVQASERRASKVLIDERAGTKIAQQHSLNVNSTLGLLLDFKRMGIIPKIEPQIKHLRRTNFWLSDSVVKRTLEEAGEG